MAISKGDLKKLIALHHPGERLKSVMCLSHAACRMSAPGQQVLPSDEADVKAALEMLGKAKTQATADAEKEKKALPPKLQKTFDVAKVARAKYQALAEVVLTWLEKRQGGSKRFGATACLSKRELAY